ncbi:MAG: pantoate--beta-alanine ligase [Eubacterium sp.]|jgi:pantoate--beta-alanine ligase|nr:pantoate--beta-alanine ligase [Eubacterium sp.]
MEITGSIQNVRETVKKWRQQGLSVGFVPTMGYLHEGHKSLIVKAVSDNDKVVVSDFVNPIQFGANEDLSTYPRDIELDKKLCEAAGADLIFHPQPDEMYASDFSTFVEAQNVSRELCGRTRPTHFRGVCTVVCKLFHIVMPDRAYFGQKDAQQLAVIRRMVRDLNMDIEIVGCPIVREADGLAKSSRNTYLNEEERKAALALSKAIFYGEEMIRNGERKAEVVLSAMRSIIEEEPLAKIDYVEMTDADSIEPIETAQGRTLTAIAVYIGKTRLIDNFIVDLREADQS